MLLHSMAQALPIPIVWRFCRPRIKSSVSRQHCFENDNQCGMLRSMWYVQLEKYRRVPQAELLADMAASQTKFEAVVEMAGTVANTLDIDELMKVMIQQTKRLLGADRCTLFLVEVPC